MGESASQPLRLATLRVGLVQMRCSEDPVQNLRRALAGIEEAADRGAGLVCLQELFRTRYFCQSEESEKFALAEPVPGPTTEALGKAAAARRVAIVGSVFERRAEGLYHNTAVTLDADGSLASVYRKMHIPDDPLYYEKFYFTPGDLGFRAAATRAGRVGALVCWDQWFPEAARLTALAGAQLLVYPTAIGWETGARPEWEAAEHDAWETAQRAHAIANGVFVAAVNRVGVEERLTFWGQSFVADPFGRVIARASASDEEVLVADCDLSLIEEMRQGWPFLRDRRIDAYGEIARRFRD
jgi:N-carbamoylputrescine amidase